MNPLVYAQRFVNLWQNSPVAGPFHEEKYPFITRPLLRIADILVRSMVVYGPSQSFKTVLLQIATAYRLDIMRGSVLAVSQTDDDSKSFAEIKLNPFLKRIKALVESLKDDKYAMKIMQWLWANHELIISGPGENAQNSKSVLYLHTDEAHLWCVAYPGALTALQGRMGERWNQAELHCTTAANAGTEIDILYHNGEQAEWHQRCIHCNKLIWPLWEDESRKEYNGHEVFKWDELPNEDEMLDSIRIVCPHCDKEIFDTYRNRIEMDEGADYVLKHPEASKANASYRWNCFAPRWKQWRGFLAKYKKALQSVKLGELAPYEEWVKKYLVVSWTGQYPMLGDSTRGRNYNVADVPYLETELRTQSVDYQAGKGDEGKHWWVLVCQWDKDGNSKRLEYKKVYSWDEVRVMQLHWKVKDEHVGVDCGHEPRDVFAACSRFHWMAFKSTDEEFFTHVVTRPGHESKEVRMPYSRQRLENSNIGKKSDRELVMPRGRHCPPGWAISRMFSKPALYPILYALKNGNTGREYGVARDLHPDFIEQLHSYIPHEERDKKSNLSKKTIWVRTKPKDHGFICAVQALLLAVLNGFYPLASIPLETAKAS